MPMDDIFWRVLWVPLYDYKVFHSIGKEVFYLDENRGLLQCVFDKLKDDEIFSHIVDTESI